MEWKIQAGISIPHYGLREEEGGPNNVNRGNGLAMGRKINITELLASKDIRRKESEKAGDLCHTLGPPWTAEIEVGWKPLHDPFWSPAP